MNPTVWGDKVDLWVEGVRPTLNDDDGIITVEFKPGSPAPDTLIVKDEVRVSVLELKAYRDSACTKVLDDWPVWYEDGETYHRSPKHVSGKYEPICFQLRGLRAKYPNKYDKLNDTVKIWTESSCKGYQGKNFVRLDLIETGINTNIFRNLDTPERLYLSDKTSSNSKKEIKVIGEEKLTYELKKPNDILEGMSGEESTYTNVSDVMVDLREVSAVDGTTSPDAETFHDLMVSRGYFSEGLYCEDKGNKADGDDDKCVELGNKVDFMYIAGHGSQSDEPTRVCAQDNTFGLKEHNDENNFQRADIWSQWSEELEYLLLAVCSTCRIKLDENGEIEYDGQGKMIGGGAEWIEAMAYGGRGHGVLGYRYGSPGTTTSTKDITIVQEFVYSLSNETVAEAWMKTNFNHKDASYQGGHWFSPLNAVAIVKNDNINDKFGSTDVSNLVTRDSTKDTFTYYYIEWTRQYQDPYIDTSKPILRKSVQFSLE